MFWAGLDLDKKRYSRRDGDMETLVAKTYYREFELQKNADVEQPNMHTNKPPRN
jgi:hypothetical protein